MSIFDVLSLAGGLCLFLYGMNVMGDALERSAGSKLELILAWIFRKEKASIPRAETRTEVSDYVPTILLVGTIVLLICASFIPNKPDITNGLILFSN